MNRIYSKTKIWNLILGFKYTMNFRGFFQRRADSELRVMTEQKNLEMQSLVTLVSQAPLSLHNTLVSQLGRPDFAACKIRWKHIAQCLNLASHFASKTLIFNKGFACTNVHWNLYIVFIAIHYVLYCILPYAEHVQHLKSGYMQNFWFYFEFCSQHLPSCYTWNMTIGFRIM